MKARVLLVTAVEIALIGLFIVFFTRRFVTRPITKLIGGFKAVSQMELDKPLDIEDSSEELDELARSFNVMRDRLRAALAEINQFTQNLETKVEERTQQLKAAQKKLLHNDRLASLGQLSASVAHEINNPISGVLNLSMLMQRMLKEDGIPPGRIEEFRKYLGQVTAETGRVGRIVSDLLAFSRRGKMKLSNVTVETRLAEDLPLAHCDASQIQQVALNLALNAAEATQTKAERRVEVSTAKGDGVVLLVVADNGDGIQPENLGKIFDPFFTTKPEGKGVGLGLAVSYGIIQAHGGEIEVKSVVGEGTTFTVSLPIEQPGAASAPPPIELVRDA
jgi:C4-dicarboxylate-specific signal transduction histidine kinase